MAEEEPVFETTTGPPVNITAASLFDGHDAAINVMRRRTQSAGAEVIHLGHDQSAKAVVDCAIQEDPRCCINIIPRRSRRIFHLHSPTS